jgi:phosphate transport system permease protein
VNGLGIPRLFSPMSAALTEIHPARGAPSPRVQRRRAVSGIGDYVFKGLTLVFALSILAIAVAIAWELWRNSTLSRHAFGLSFLHKSIWDPIAEDFGALTFVFGTLVSSAIALAIAVPLGIGVAIFLAELAPRKFSDICAFLIELLAAIPSVVYGLIGVFVLVPWMRKVFQPFLVKTLGFLPFFQGPCYGIGMLTAGIVLAIMIIPFITSISREVFLTVPQPLKEAAMALGATHWEVVRLSVLPYSRSGIAGAVFLALGRALGETMAVTMVIGNVPQISASIIAPGYTMAAVLANEFSEATTNLYLSTLVEIGLVLFVITILVNAVGRLILARMGGHAEGH